MSWLPTSAIFWLRVALKSCCAQAPISLATQIAAKVGASNVTPCAVGALDAVTAEGAA